MDADSVSHMMHCNRLITDDDYEAITAAPNDWMMNVLILEYIRVMDPLTLLKFVSLLETMETQRSIGSSLKSCMYIKPCIPIYTHMYCSPDIHVHIYLHIYTTVYCKI